MIASSRVRKLTLWVVGAAVAALGGAPATSAAATTTTAGSAPAGPVVVQELTTPVQQVWDNPDGTRTAELSSTPVRVQKSGEWVPIDPSLVLAADGQLRPQATLTDVALSSGGSSPLVTLRRAGTTLRLAWPGALPAPTLDGAVATYPEVAPGVDLRVTALPDGVSEVLVVKSAAASRASVVRNLVLSASVTGGALSANSVGGVDLRDSAGALVFRNGSATLWDAAALNSAEKTQMAAEQPISGVLAEGAPAADVLRAHPQASHRGSVSLGVGATTLSVTPDASILDAATTQYPVVIDPQLTPSSASAWSMISSAFPTTSYYKWSSSDEGVGYSDFQSPVMTKRLYYSFATGALAGTHILSAQFSATETWSSGCSARAVDLWRTGNLSSSSTWNTRPGWTTKIATATVAHGNPACSTSGTTITPTDYNVEFNAISAVTTIASSGLTSATFGLKAASETDDLAWKRFKADGKLTVSYDHAPNKPSALNIVSPAGAALGCGTQANPSLLNTSQWYARGNFTDADTGDKLTATFKYWSDKNGTLISIRNIGPQAQGQIQTLLWGGPDRVTYGDVYRWQAYSTDPSGQASVTVPSASTYCWLKIDTSAPTSPVVKVTLGQTPTSPPADGSPITGVAAGAPLTFSFTPGGVASDTWQYRWSVNSDTPGAELLPATHVSGASVAKSITLNSSGPNTVRVWAYDQLGNQSGATEFPFVATGSTPARWSLDESSSPAAFDTSCVPTGSGPSPSAMTWASGITSSAGKFGNALTLSTGAAATSSTSPIAALNTQENPSAAVTAWVHIDPSVLTASPFVPRTLFSVDGPYGSAMLVGVELDGAGMPRFQSRMAQVGGGTSVTVWDNTDLSSDAWYQVAAAMDYDNSQLQLVVMTSDPVVGDSVSPARVADVPKGNAVVQLIGAQRLGAAKTSTGTLVNQWLGQIDEVRVFRTPFTPPSDQQVAPDLTSWLTKAATPGAPLC